MSNTASSPSVVPFRFESNEVRALNINGDPWFVAKDVCEVLEHSNYRMAVDGLDEDEKGVSKVYTPGGDQEMIIISESGLYTLIIRSNKPQAKPFRKWVTAEVLPSIRKTGGYYTLRDHGRTSRADIFHHRGPRSDSGLDIRYTLDLTKVITNPKRSTLALLERLTGVTVADLAAEFDRVGSIYRDKVEVMALLDRFATAHLIPDPAASVLFRDLYGLFLRWYGEHHLDGSFVPSAKAMAAWLDAHDYPRRKPGGNATVYGVALAGEVRP
jgi:prophage antirepressor-like protein